MSKVSKVLGEYNKIPIVLWTDLPKRGEFVSVTDLSKITGLSRRTMDTFVLQLPEKDRTVLEQEPMLTWYGTHLLMCDMEDSKKYDNKKVTRLHPFLQWWIEQTEK